MEISREEYDTLTAFVSPLYGRPHEDGSIWAWQEITLPARLATDVRGFIKAVTEMEALDRLREMRPDVGAIQWTGRRKDPFGHPTS